MEQLPAEVVDRLMGRVEVEERLARNQLTNDERMQLIAEPFRVLEYQFQQQVKGGKGETHIAVAVAVWLAPTLAAFILWSEVNGPGRRPDPSMKLWAIACTVVACASLVLTFYLVITKGRRTASGVMFNRLATSLLPLRPTETELNNVMQSLRGSTSAFAKSLRVEDLVRRLG